MSLPRFGLVMVGLMWVVPELCYRHDYPLTSFHQEWIAAGLGLLAMIPLAGRKFREKPEIPRIILLPAGMLLIVIIQLMLGKIAHLGQAMLFCLYFLWAGFLVILGRHLREEIGLPAAALVLASFLLAGSELSALAGFLQHFHWHTFLDHYVSARNAAAVYGNMVQPNHFADYICLGLVSLGLLHSRFAWRWQTVLFAVPLLFVLVLSGSRSAWLYLACMTAMAGLFREGRFLKYGLSILAGFALMHFVVEIPWLAATSGNVTSAGRLFREASSGSIRLHLWHEAWTIFLNHPILGAGFGQYAWQHFSLGPVLRDRVIVGAYNNAHDIAMQLAAETGLAGLAVFFATSFFWIRQALGAKPDSYRCWGVTLLAVMGIHSLLEYPLWYAHFIGIFAILLGMLDDTFWKPDLRSRLPASAMLLLGWLALFQILSDYRSLEGLLKKKTGESDIAYYERARATFSHVGITSPIRPYMELAMSSLIVVNPEHLDDKISLNGAVLHFIPTSQVAYRQARLLALSGKKAEAGSIMAMAAWSYPAKSGN